MGKSEKQIKNQSGIIIKFLIFCFCLIRGRIPTVPNEKNSNQTKGTLKTNLYGANDLK